MIEKILDILLALVLMACIGVASIVAYAIIHNNIEGNNVLEGRKYVVCATKDGLVRLDSNDIFKFNDKEWVTKDQRTFQYTHCKVIEEGQ